MYCLFELFLTKRLFSYLINKVILQTVSHDPFSLVNIITRTYVYLDKKACSATRSIRRTVDLCRKSVLLKTKKQ